MYKLKKTDEQLLHDFAEKGPVRFLPGLGLSEAHQKKYLVKNLKDSLFSDDVTLIADEPSSGVILRLEYLPWDSEMLGVPSARIEKFQKSNAGKYSKDDREKLIGMAIDEARKRNIKFLHIKLPADEMGWLNTLEKKNFRIKDNELVLLHNKKPLPAQESSVPILCLSGQEPVPGLEELAPLFSCSRFSNDDHIEQDRVINLWKTSLENCCRGFADKVYVAQKDHENPAGGLALRRTEIGDEKIFSVYLLGVKKDFQRKGIGASLIGEALQYVSGQSLFFIVETQSHNYSALGFYQKAGFDHIIESRLSLHCWL